MGKTLIVAELSANHGCKLEYALETVKAVAASGADAVKIQTYTADTITLNCQSELFCINDGTLWDGRFLYDLYKEAHTPWEWHKSIQDEAKAHDLLFFSSPFDFTAVDFLESINNPIYKIASFEINDIPLIQYAASKGKPMIISTGIASISEIQDAVEACRKVGNPDITLLQCTSSYPTPVDEVNLRTMVNLKDTFGVKVGLSDHTMESSVAVAAVALGAEIVEKHFILDRSLGGPDAAFSIEPRELKELVHHIRVVERSLGRVDYTLSENKKNSRKFSRSLFVVKSIRKGELFTGNNIRSIRPGFGLQPKCIQEVLGKKARTDLTVGTPLKLEHIDE